MYALPQNRGLAGAGALGRDTELNGTGGSFLRPRGDITTVLDLTSRDAQDGTFFPPDTPSSWFHRAPFTTYPATMVTQEYPHKGTAAWGGRLTFELGALTAGDLLQGIILQIKLSSWYNADTVLRLLSQNYGISSTSPNPAWTYINGIGTSIIEYAEFEVGDQTLERLDGAFLRAYQSIFPDENMVYGMATDGLGLGSSANVANNTGPMNIDRPWPTEGGTLFCLLPFFFFRTRFKEVFPLLSVPEGTVRIHVQLRPFDQCVRNSTHIRSSCTDTPLGKPVELYEFDNSGNKIIVPVTNDVPAFLDFRVVTYGALVDGSVREAYIQKPFEQLTKFVQTFSFDEPYNYISAKQNSETDTIELSVPLELNHPCTELFWVFRRKGVQINNEWGNFGTLLESQWTADAVAPAWLDYATLRVNGLVIDEAEGEWWRYCIAKAHRGGINTYANNVYGYSFAQYPDNHQPSGTANMSRASSVRLDLRVRVPPAVANPGGFQASVGQGWELFIYAIHYNWLRFENGICQKIFED